MQMGPSVCWSVIKYDSASPKKKETTGGYQLPCIDRYGRLRSRMLMKTTMDHYLQHRTRSYQHLIKTLEKSSDGYNQKRQLRSELPIKFGCLKYTYSIQLAFLMSINSISLFVSSFVRVTIYQTYHIGSTKSTRLRETRNMRKNTIFPTETIKHIMFT